MLGLPLAAALLATNPLDGQRVLLFGAFPCVRLLNATGIIGCATPSRAAIAPLAVATDAPALARLLDDPPDGELAVALSASLFGRTSLNALQRGFGAALRGVVVLHAAALPPGASSPEPATPWLPGGSGLALERFPFGIVLLTKSESEAVLEHAAPPGTSSSPPLLEIRYPMNARGDAPSCLAVDECLPVGGQSVWGSVAPRVATDASSPPSPLLPPSRRAVGLAAALDARSFFHDAAPGAYAAVAPLAALLAAVGSIASNGALAAQLPSFSALHQKCCVKMLLKHIFS